MLCNAEAVYASLQLKWDSPMRNKCSIRGCLVEKKEGNDDGAIPSAFSPPEIPAGRGGSVSQSPGPNLY